MPESAILIWILQIENFKLKNANWNSKTVYWYFRVCHKLYPGCLLLVRDGAEYDFYRSQEAGLNNSDYSTIGIVSLPLAVLDSAR